MIRVRHRLHRQIIWFLSFHSEVTLPSLLRQAMPSSGTHPSGDTPQLPKEQATAKALRGVPRRAQEYPHNSLQEITRSARPWWAISLSCALPPPPSTGGVRREGHANNGMKDKEIKLKEQLEAGHSDAFTAYFTAMGRLHNNPSATFLRSHGSARTPPRGRAACVEPTGPQVESRSPIFPGFIGPVTEREVHPYAIAR